VRTSLKAAALAVAALLPVVALSTASAEATGAGAYIKTVSVTAHVSTDRLSIPVKITYTCRNAEDVRYYLVGGIQQPATDAVTYSYGQRGNHGTQRASCTGRSVTQTVNFLRSSFAMDGHKPLGNGTGELMVRLDARGVLGPGWYNERTPDYAVIRTVNVVTR
jgi:hypothetical protein